MVAHKARDAQPKLGQMFPRPRKTTTSARVWAARLVLGGLPFGRQGRAEVVFFRENGNLCPSFGRVWDAHLVLFEFLFGGQGRATVSTRTEESSETKSI